MLITWNMQGQNPSAYILNNKAQGFSAPYNVIPDFLCIQESGMTGWEHYIEGGAINCDWNPYPSYRCYFKIRGIILNANSFNGYVIPWQASAEGNNRCSMMILWAESLGDHAKFPISGEHDGNPKHRPFFWITPASGVGRLGCIHAPSGGGVTTLTYIYNAVQAISVGSAAQGWVIAGDFNYDAKLMAGQLPFGTSKVDSGESTQKSGGNLDYLLEDSANKRYSNAKAAESYVQSDHLQVRFL